MAHPTLTGPVRIETPVPTVKRRWTVGRVERLVWRGILYYFGTVCLVAWLVGYSGPGEVLSLQTLVFCAGFLACSARR